MKNKDKKDVKKGVVGLMKMTGIFPKGTMKKYHASRGKMK